MLASEFETIRKKVGSPVKVASAFRTPDWNRQVGGARNSQHLQGRALDLRPPKSWTVERFYGVVRARALDPASRIYGLGKYQTFVHIDVRPPGEKDRLVVWQGSRAWAEVKV